VITDNYVNIKQHEPLLERKRSSYDVGSLIWS